MQQIGGTPRVTHIQGFALEEPIMESNWNWAKVAWDIKSLLNLHIKGFALNGPIMVSNGNFSIDYHCRFLESKAFYMTKPFWPMVHRGSDMSEVTSGARADIENVKNDRPSDLQFQLYHQRSLLKCHCTFYIYGALGKKVLCQILQRWLISSIIGQNVQRLLIFAVFCLMLIPYLKKKHCEIVIQSLTYNPVNGCTK